VSLSTKLKALRGREGLTQAALCGRFGLAQAFLSQMETGHRRTIPADLAARLTAAFGLPAEHFAEHLSERAGKAQEAAGALPFLGWLAAGAGEDDPADPGETVALPAVCRRADGVYRVRGLSMREAGILPGDYLAVRKTQTPADGDVVAAWLTDAGSVVKRVQVDELPATGSVRYTLHSADGRADPRYPRVMTPGDHFYGVMVASFRAYPGQRVPPLGRAKRGKRK